MGFYDDFSVDNSTKDDLGTFFQITKKEDFIQEVTITSLEVDQTQFGKSLKVTINQGEKTTSGWYLNENKGDYDYNGKLITIAMQNDTAKAKIAQLGRALLGEEFGFKPTSNTFEGMVNGLNLALKDVLGKKTVFCRLTLNGKFANLATKDGRTFSDDVSKLTVPTKDIAKLTALSNPIIPDEELDFNEPKNDLGF